MGAFFIFRSTAQGGWATFNLLNNLRRMKTSILIAATVLAVFPVSLVADSPNQRIEAAQKQAVSEKKDLMLIFSGSDWSSRSRQFDTEILETEAFKKATSGEFVQVVFNLPAKREEAHENILELQKKYRFRQMPTVILADRLARPYGYTGLLEGSVDDHVKQFGELRKVRIERDRLIGESEKANGVEKAELLVKALKAMPQEAVPIFYQKELKAIENADPKGKTGYAAGIRKSEALEKEQERYNRYFREKNYAQVLKESRADAAKAKGEDAQRLLLYGIRALADQQKYDEASKAVEEMAKIDPKSSLGQRAERYQAMLKTAKERKNRPKKPAGPIVSKPVAVVTDIAELRKDADAIDADLEKSTKKLSEVKKKAEAGSARVADLEAQVVKAREEEKKFQEALKKASEEQEKLARKSKAMREVIANHEAMEKRKREVAELEKRAAALQKEAEELRKKASDIKKGK